MTYVGIKYCFVSVMFFGTHDCCVNVGLFFMLCDFSGLIGLNAVVQLACGKLKYPDSILFEFLLFFFALVMW